MDRRAFIQVAAAGLVALATPRWVDGGLEMIAGAEAANGVPIGEYYDSGYPVFVMPGAKKCPKSAVKGKRLGFRNDEWFQYFFDNAEYSGALQNMFRELDGQAIPINSPQMRGQSAIFNYDKFYRFNQENRGQFKAVTLWYDGFMSYGGPKIGGRIVIPIVRSVIDQVSKL